MGQKMGGEMNILTGGREIICVKLEIEPNGNSINVIFFKIHSFC
jgi:hypothetical protein